MKTKGSEYSNFIFRAGSFKLLGLLKSRLWPIFKLELGSTRGEVYGYQFLNVEALVIKGEPVIVGRLVQRMKLQARQKLKGKRLRPSRATLGSDPSSIFVLTLSNHKLMIIPEQPRGPRTPTFKFVFLRLLDQAWRGQLVKSQAAFKRKLGKKRLTPAEKELFFKSFLAKYPKNSLEINPISAPSDAGRVINDFDHIRRLKITHFKTNNEDYSTEQKLIDLFGKSLKKTNSDRANQEYINTHEGLEIAEVGNLLEASAKTGGNATFRVDGSLKGVQLTRTDENTQVKPEVPYSSDVALPTIAAGAINVVNGLVEKGIVRLGENTEDTSLETALEAIGGLSK